ncbi:juvenile hormone esterase isoform X2 [Halictus rubicundus]|uniref:juvenile hormone esterase isoform X2 n=1 Tax=Halictus rubicundus TaxID=77578 RepID=UPI004036C08F
MSVGIVAPTSSVRNCHMACEDPVVTVKQGQLRGAVDENVYGGKFLAFRGIPFAKPPTGPLRFKDPQPPEPWTGIREAKEFGNSCGQLDFMTHQVIGDDDCLYLNVYTPTIDVSSKRTVMVWIHGGGFVSGAGDSSLYGPDYIIRKDVVLVTINYRVGVFGFLNLETEEAPGNQGLKDQVMALKWVQENISSFGGDPNNVTIFGESAGGASVHYLCISPMSQGLFHKAISQSGVSTNPWAILTKNVKKHAIDLAAFLGKETTDPQEVVEFLRTIETQKLAEAHQKLLTKNKSYVMIGLFGPTVDSKSSNPFMPQHPSIQMKSGVKVPLLIGNNDKEGTLFVSNLKKTMETLNTEFERALHPEMEETLEMDEVSPDQLKRLYFGNETINMESQESYACYFSDLMFIRGIHDTVKLQAEKNLPTYFYRFTFDPEISITKRRLGITAKGATHAEELIFQFYPYLLKAMGIPPPEPGTKEYNVVEYLTQMWTDFAKTGNPTPMTTNLIPTLWKPIEKGDTIQYMNIGEKLRMESIKLEDHTSNWKFMKNKL